MSTYWAPAPAHHAYVASVDGDTVSDYGAYLHESQTEDPKDTAAVDALRKTFPVPPKAAPEGLPPVVPETAADPTQAKPKRTRRKLLGPWRCHDHLRKDLPSAYRVVPYHVLTQRMRRVRAMSIEAALEKRAARVGQVVRY